MTDMTVTHQNSDVAPRANQLIDQLAAGPLSLAERDELASLCAQDPSVAALARFALRAQRANDSFASDWQNTHAASKQTSFWRPALLATGAACGALLLNIGIQNERSSPVVEAVAMQAPTLVDDRFGPGMSFEADQFKAGGFE
jgi:anti-sigma-K factor RskA